MNTLKEKMPKALVVLVHDTEEYLNRTILEVFGSVESAEEWVSNSLPEWVGELPTPEYQIVIWC